MSAVAGSLLLSGMAMATDYSLEGVVRYNAGHDDNLQLSEQPDSSLSQTTSGRLNFSGASEQTQAGIDAQLWMRRYNSSGFDSDDQAITTHLAHRSERNQWSLDFSAIRDSTLTSELLDSGRLESAERHEQYAVTPGWSYQLSEKDLLSLQGSYVISSYSGESYTDYDYWQTQLLWTHSLTERLRAFVSFDHSDYQSQALQYPDSQTYATASTENGLQVGGDYQLSENISASLLVGKSRSENDVQIGDPLNYCARFSGTPQQVFFPLCALQDTETSLATYKGSIAFTRERSQFSLSASRGTEPSSNGYVQQTDQANLAWQHRAFEQGTIRLSATFGKTDASDDRSSRSREPARDFLFTTLSYTHTLSEEWSIDFSYRYRTQKYETSDRVESNAGFAGISWTPRSRHWSR